MATMRDKIIEQIDDAIKKTQESVDFYVNNIEVTDEDDDIDEVAYDMKRIRTLKSLKHIVETGMLPEQGHKESYMLRDILEDMLDLDL